MQTPHIVMAIWTITLIAAAISDLRSFRIPNFLPAILILLYGVTSVMTGFSSASIDNVLHFLVALVVGMVLFSRGWVGGGDAKLYAAAALWFDWAGAVALIFTTTIAGAALAMILIAARLLGLRKDVPREDRRIPYGVAIATGAILTATWTGWDRVFPAVS
jgi:prepilin peptidase CpaA